MVMAMCMHFYSPVACLTNGVLLNVFFPKHFFYVITGVFNLKYLEILLGEPLGYDVS